MAWQVVEAVLPDCPFPSNHPNYPGTFRSRGRSARLLVEDVSKHSPDEYYGVVVPDHLPALMQFAILGEVLLTPMCKLNFENFYDTNAGKGAWFAWPSAAAVFQCPATGKRIKPDMQTIHVLVAQELIGCANQARNYSTDLRLVVMPRVLTLEGLRQMISHKFPGVPPGGLKRLRTGQPPIPASKLWENENDKGTVASLTAMFRSSMQGDMGDIKVIQGLDVRDLPSEEKRAPAPEIDLDKLKRKLKKKKRKN